MEEYYWRQRGSRGVFSLLFTISGGVVDLVGGGVAVVLFVGAYDGRPFAESQLTSTSIISLSWYRR